MIFSCLCRTPSCRCSVDVVLTEREQNEIILARIWGEALEQDMVSLKVCDECIAGWHITDPVSDRRVFKEPERAPNNG